MRGLCSLLLLLVAVGCSAGERTLFVSLPPIDTGARSLVAALRTTNTLFVAASEVDRASVELPLTELGAGELHVLFYAEPLAELGLMRGEVPRAADGEPGHSLGPPLAIYRTDYLAGVADPWTRSATLARELAEFRVRGARPVDQGCVDFRELRFSVPERSNATFVVALTATVALVGFEGGALFHVDRGGVRAVGSLGSGPFHSAHRVTAGEVWVAGIDGRVARISPRIELPRAPSGERIEWLSGSRAGEALELFAVSRKGSFEVWREDRWQVLIPSSGSEDWRRGLAALGPGEAIAAGVGSGLVRARDGVVSDQRVEGTPVMMAAASVEGIGVLAGTIDGEVYVEDGNVWRTLADSPLALPVTQLVGFRDGFVAAGGGGYVVQYRREGGYCTEVQTGHPIIKHVAAIEGAVVLGGDRASGTLGDSFVSVLEYERF